MLGKKITWGIILLLVLFCFACSDGNESNNTDGNNNTSKTIVGIWTKSGDGLTALLTVKTDHTWNTTINGVDMGISEATWDENGLKFKYMDGSYITWKYTLSNNGNTMILNGQDLQLMGGTSPWTRVK